MSNKTATRWHGEDLERLAIGALVGILVVLLWLLLVGSVAAHDWRRPDLDQWYGSLRNPRSNNGAIQRFGCCSKQDCHETEAELRGNDWWARLGRRTYAPGGGNDWELQEWVRVPTEAVLLNQANPTGNAVICHEVSLMEGGTQVSPRSRVWCFIPPTET